MILGPCTPLRRDHYNRRRSLQEREANVRAAISDGRVGGGFASILHLIISEKIEKCTYEKPLKYQYQITSSFIVSKLLCVANVARAATCPVDVAALCASPILSTKKQDVISEQDEQLQLPGLT